MRPRGPSSSSPSTWYVGQVARAKAAVHAAAQDGVRFAALVGVACPGSADWVCMMTLLVPASRRPGLNSPAGSSSCFSRRVNVATPGAKRLEHTVRRRRSARYAARNSVGVPAPALPPRHVPMPRRAGRSATAVRPHSISVVPERHRRRGERHRDPPQRARTIEEIVRLLAHRDPEGVGVRRRPPRRHRCARAPPRWPAGRRTGAPISSPLIAGRRRHPAGGRDRHRQAPPCGE